MRTDCSVEDVHHKTVRNGEQMVAVHGCLSRAKKYEHADNDKDVPQGNEDPEVSQALQEFADPVSNGRLLLTLVKGVWCPLLQLKVEDCTCIRQ